VSVVEKPRFSVRIRDLVNFVWRRGDLGGSREFVRSDRALAGTRAHQDWQRSRPAGYQKEVPVRREVECDELILQVQGRIDGVLVTNQGVVLEELKSVRGSWDGQADPLHWAQARLYALLYADNSELESIALRLIYIDLDSGAITPFEEFTTRNKLLTFFDQTVARYLIWIRALQRWRHTRNVTIHSLAFPFVRYRPGQRQIAVTAYRTLMRGGRLFMEAPTGIGKTASVLFPALKALGEGHLDQIFYLTARTVGRLTAGQALEEMRAAGLRLRSLTLTAKEKVCVQNGVPCDTASCPLALGYYDRCHDAMREALDRENLTRHVLDSVARAHQVCPHELALDLSTWVDVIVCDYNYVFDPKVYLRRHFADGRGPFGFLVDEAHNLVDRARDMFSASLDDRDLGAVRRLLARALPHGARALNRLHITLRKLARREALAMAPEHGAHHGELDLFPVESPDARGARLPVPDGMHSRRAEQEATTITRLEFPEELIAPLDAALQTMEVELARNQPAPYREPLLDLYFRLHAFRRSADLYDERFATLIQSSPSVQVRLLCLDPSFLLRQALDRGKSTVFFSATLAPTDYYQSLLGGSPEDPRLQLPSPFAPEHLAVLVHDRVRTQLRSRAGSLDEVVRAIGALVEGRRGNYLVYFPSYQYLEAVRTRFQALHPDLPTLAQHSGMTEAERESFLAAFSTEPDTNRIGFAVLGGIFGEGIDLVGDRLLGAVIVGVGLPQVCPERDLIRDHFSSRRGGGFDYAYTFPGMNRVLQAIGRVIRSESDRGIVLLLDARFGQARYRQLFPAWWQPVRVVSADEIRSAVRAYWNAAC
jgi:DNA excision repair protein ERCC-2